MALLSFSLMMFYLSIVGTSIVVWLFWGFMTGLGYAIYPLVAAYLQDEAYIHWMTWQSPTSSKPLRERLAMAAKHQFFTLTGGRFAVVILAIPQILLFAMLGFHFHLLR
jgi:hypothetical protein